MYTYEFDSETGGILLNSSPSVFSLEPRPVYAPELDMLGFNKFWEYEPQSEIPYMWVQTSSYYYRGIEIAKTRGGNLYTAPELIPTDEGLSLKEKLIPVDITEMCRRNRKLLKVIEASTVKRIVNIYERYRDKVDVFHVAFSGGKDSAVLLELVRKSLPEKSFVVVFGDTGMEFPDTYKAVEVTRKFCESEGIPFYVSRSRFEPSESWRLFGPPARVLRWCCSVHKSAPQTLKLREILGKNDYVGMDFVGVRKHESEARSKYKFLNYGEKQKGQYSYNAILNWTSAEVWLYMFANNLFVNDAYKKGNARVGCLLCPLSGGNSNYARRYNYTDKIDEFISLIRELNNWDEGEALDTYVTSGGWNARYSGRSIKDNVPRYKETKVNGKINIEVTCALQSWGEWLKTVNTSIIPYKVTQTSEGFIFSLDEYTVKHNPSEARFFRQALKKAAYCIACGECEANCREGHLKFKDGRVSIDACTRCHECHEISAGCLVYNSLKIPEGEIKVKSINCFDDHAPKEEWLSLFFTLKDDFFRKHSLGPNMFSHFKRFLKDAGLADKGRLTDFAELICSMTWDSTASLGLMLVNLAYDNPQFEWYIGHLNIGQKYTMPELKEALLNSGLKEKGANSVLKSYKRIVSTPFGTKLNFGHVDSADMITRCECALPDNRVLLYALYKFAEKCNLDHEFHLSYLFTDDSQRDGISPVKIFGLHYDEDLPTTEKSKGIQSRLLGLSAAYPEFINAAFTNDLRTITLRDKTSSDVLNLFLED